MTGRLSSQTKPEDRKWHVSDGRHASGHHSEGSKARLRLEIHNMKGCIDSFQEQLSVFQTLSLSSVMNQQPTPIQAEVKSNTERNAQKRMPI